MGANFSNLNLTLSDVYVHSSGGKTWLFWFLLV